MDEDDAKALEVQNQVQEQQYGREEDRAEEHQQVEDSSDALEEVG